MAASSQENNLDPARADGQDPHRAESARERIAGQEATLDDQSGPVPGQDTQGRSTAAGEADAPQASEEETEQARERSEELGSRYEDDDRPTVVVPGTDGTLSGTAFADGQFEGDPTENPAIARILEQGRSPDIERDPNARVTVPDDRPEGEAEHRDSHSVQ